MRRRLLLVPALVLSACVSGGAEVEEPVPSLFDDPPPSAETSPSTASSSTASTTTAPIAERLPALSADAPGAVATEDGLVLPVTGTDGDVWFLLGPCGENRVETVSSATRIDAAHVVLDPGGADDEAGRLNLAVARRTAEILEEDGVVVALTRTGPIEVGASTRGALGPALGARVLVSIQRGDATTSPTGAPRPSVFHRADDADSRRLAGLVHHAVTAAFADVGGGFLVADEPGVRPLLNQRGEDYFRVLQASAGVAAARIEMFTPAENETTLLTEEEGRELEARALADAIVHHLVTSEEGDGFIEPIETVRTAPTSNTPGGC